MSKAFTKESEVQQDIEKELLDEYSPPPGGKNFLTAAGYERLRAELIDLETLAAPRSRDAERRMRCLIRCLAVAEIPGPPPEDTEEAMFGARVTVRDEGNRVNSYQIVGIDEADLKSGQISWTSPLGSCLLKARAGDFVIWSTPRGELELEVLEVSYQRSKAQ